MTQECPKCRGTGRLTVGEKCVNGMMKPRRETCDRCDGEGEIERDRGKPKSVAEKEKRLCGG